MGGFCCGFVAVGGGLGLLDFDGGLALVWLCCISDCLKSVIIITRCCWFGVFVVGCLLFGGFGYCVFCYFFWLAVYVLRGVLLMFLGGVVVVGLGLDVLVVVVVCGVLCLLFWICCFCLKCMLRCCLLV